MPIQPQFCSHFCNVERLEWIHSIAVGPLIENRSWEAGKTGYSVAIWQDNEADSERWSSHAVLEHVWLSDGNGGRWQRLGDGNQNWRVRDLERAGPGWSRCQMVRLLWVGVLLVSFLFFEIFSARRKVVGVLGIKESLPLRYPLVCICVWRVGTKGSHKHCSIIAWDMIKGLYDYVGAVFACLSFPFSHACLLSFSYAKSNMHVSTIFIHFWSLGISLDLQ